MSKRKSTVRRRVVKISVCHPIFVEVEVQRGETDDAWEITAVLRSSVEATPRSLHECMGDSEFDEMDRIAESAEDIS